MNKRKLWFWIIGVAILIIAGLFAGGLSTLGFLPWQSVDLYEDPQGRFSMEVDPGWEQIETGGAYTKFKIADPPINLYVLALEAGTIDEAFFQAFEVLGLDPGLLKGGSFASF